MDGVNKLSAVLEAEKPDKIIFLGDMYYHGPRNPLPALYAPMDVCNTIKGWKLPFIIVKGNCDSAVDETITGIKFRSQYSICSAKKRVLCLHGDRMPHKASNCLIIHGHSHQNLFYEKDGVRCLSIASLSMPKNASPASYAIVENGTIIVKSLEGNIIEGIQL